MTAATTTATHRAIETVWKLEAPRLIAGLLRLVRDLDQAEDLAQEALLAALEHWPADGIPDNPGAWLMTTAKRRALDVLRRQKLLARKHEELGYEIETVQYEQDPVSEQTAAPGSDEDMLRLMFIACHPLLAPEARVALTLRLLGGLRTDEIARAFLIPEPTIAQRIVRAKRMIAKHQAPFEEPDAVMLRERLTTVLEVVYLIFNEGYTATAGEDWLRPALCEDALRLGRILAGLAPQEAEAHGLIALLELQASRQAARTDANGAPILLQDQNRALWNQLLIRRGLAALERARQLARDPGPYVLQAEIAACHARARRAVDTDWPAIAALYALLAQRMPSPVVELNRAVALTMAQGAQAGLAHLDTLRDEPALQAYHLLPSVRGDFLYRLGRYPEAQAEFTRAAGLTQNTREQKLLLDRAQACENAVNTRS